MLSKAQRPLTVRLPAIVLESARRPHIMSTPQPSMPRTATEYS